MGREGGTVKELTAVQKKILDFLLRRRRKALPPPTVRELAAHFGYHSANNARQHLRLIEQKGYIRRLTGKSRGIELVGVADEELRMVRAPLVGAIAAGRPLTAEENREGHIALDRSLFPSDRLFTLRVRGDSMKDAGIFDGDIAVLRQQASVDENEIAAVLVEGEATLKRCVRREGRLVLRAENPAYRDIVVAPDREVQIAGLLVGVIRKY